MANSTGMMIAQVVVSILLVTVILLQQRGTGLGGAFGGEGNVYRSRRGAERFLFIMTIILGITFVVLTGLSVYYQNN